MTYLFPTDPTPIKRKVVVSCSSQSCKGLITHTSGLSDNSPRVSGACEICDRQLSVKLSRLPLERIVSEELIYQ